MVKTLGQHAAYSVLNFKIMTLSSFVNCFANQHPFMLSDTDTK